MSDVRGTQLTYAGLSLLAKCLTGKELHFTRVVMGDGRVSDDQNLKQLTGLVSPKLNLPIKDVKVTGSGTTIMETALKNASLTTPFFAREIGIFAIDPDTETEILYAVRNTGDDSEYVPAGGGSEVWDLIYDVMTVVDQAPNITANIDGSIAYVSRLDFYDHIENTNPHPNWLQVKPATANPSHFWAQDSSDGQLHPITFDDAKKKILGGDGTDMQTMIGRVEQVEREQSNMALQLEAQQIYPDYNALLAEDFVVPDTVDLFSCQITGVAAGDDSLDLATLVGIVPGAWYTISDGVNQEAVQIKSIVKNGSTIRAICMSPIVNTYVTAAAMIYRTTAQISAAQAQGAGGRSATVWQPTTIWSGVSANNPVTATLNTSQDNAAAFSITGDIAFTADGKVTLA